MEPGKRIFSDFGVETQYGFKILQAVVYLSSTRLYSSGPCQCQKRSQKKHFLKNLLKV